jgi:hypothetical protein
MPFTTLDRIVGLFAALQPDALDELVPAQGALRADLPPLGSGC